MTISGHNATGPSQNFSNIEIGLSNWKAGVIRISSLPTGLSDSFTIEIKLTKGNGEKKITINQSNLLYGVSF